MVFGDSTTVWKIFFKYDYSLKLFKIAGPMRKCKITSFYFSNCLTPYSMTKLNIKL